MQHFLVVSAVVLLVIYGSRYLESKWPIAHTPTSEVRDDWLAAIVSVGLPMVLGPLTAMASVALWGWAGAGLLTLPIEGYWYFVSLAFLVVVLDLYKYGFHRLQHKIPFLWSMHSFHHSASALTLITGARHFWFEKVGTNVLLPVLPVLFKYPTEMAGIIGIIFFLPDACAHLNVRFSMGRMITWVNSPQWHRIHHSVLPQHYDKNFAALLPLWDFVFGTAWVPQPDEYPDTGFDPHVRVDMLDSIIWPLRQLRQRFITHVRT